MGTPACRIGDETEHGGVIVVGFPTVLIGDMPAARIGDDHVCPMQTPGLPPIPHVGGPFVMGSPTVLVGEMPQSRVTDQLVCVGPPDMAVMGEPTVLVGMAGAAGMAGALSGLQAIGFALPSLAPPAGLPQSTLQADGTIKTSGAPGASLPPITLQQTGWPDLPAQHTANFASVQPVTLPAGCTLQASTDVSDAAQGYWSVLPPDPGSSSSPGNLGTPSAQPITVVQGSAGTKAWMGQPAGAPAESAPQIWLPSGDATLQASSR